MVNVTLSEILKGEVRKRSVAAGSSYQRARETPPEAAEARLLAGQRSEPTVGMQDAVLRAPARGHWRRNPPQSRKQGVLEGAGSEAGTSTNLSTFKSLGTRNSTWASATIESELSSSRYSGDCRPRRVCSPMSIAMHLSCIYHALQSAFVK